MLLSGHHDVAFLNDILNDVESDTKIDNYVIIASFKSEPTCTLKNKIPGLRLWYQVYSAQLRERMLNHNSTTILEALPGKLYIKRHSPSIF